ncbi:uncharacterized protein PGTG_09451 [Puccinia graminis f. sp. tritici CRL 75-36-700-3]|uniref:Uncharacterized protein n=1 Tax=Puccinia graminis f. sp. tritici (strain CRL 75-36-700-3 / race SCCL) TaxID=418459 RepID=E3KHG3_PUCGT|nr:uncharacterized protein PGTG_09451 [Puccinia graminis f. sp. tritici CRL 75-36-700-3]EFP83738.1 hypothetical protein PGTG_09451 [Puccinia graminis f. sp. tritici CRL 75-36-700-3]
MVPTGASLASWRTNVGSHSWEEFKRQIVYLLSTPCPLFAQMLACELEKNTIKWQLILSGSRVFGPKKNYFATGDQDLYEFAGAIQDNPKAAVTVKLVMDDPQAKAKQSAAAKNTQDSLTLKFGNKADRTALELQRARLMLNPKADTSSNPLTPVLAKLMAHIKGKYGLNEEQLWIGNPNNEEEGMQIFNNRLTAWARALQHGKNAAITLDHPPETEEFKWIKRRVPTLDSLSAPIASPKKRRSTSGAANTGAGCGVGGSHVVTPAASADSTPDLPTTLPIEEEDPMFPVDYESEVEVVWEAPNLGGMPADSPGGGTRYGSPARKYIRSPTGDVMGSAMSQLSFMRTRSSSRRSPPISPARKQTSSSVRSSATGSVVLSNSSRPPMSVLRALPVPIPAGDANANTSADNASNTGPDVVVPNQPNAAGRAMNMEQFLTHCNFQPTDMVPRGLIQLNHIAHWSTFLTMTARDLTLMSFPEATARQIIYGTTSLRSDLLES